MKKNKAFTLIELIAVLVILAAIALIVTPLVMNMVKKVKDSANKRSVDGYGRALELALATHLIEPGTYPETLDDLTVEYTGNEVICNVKKINEDGSIYLSECSVSGVDVKDPNADDGYYHYGKLKIRTYENGEVIYFNPETNKMCSEEEVLSTTGTKTGCMRWYAFNDSEGQTTVNVILDHNTTPLVPWNSNNVNTEMLEVKDALNNDIATWNESVKITARLIKADEIAQITGNKTFDVLTTPWNEYFFFDTNTSKSDTSINAKGLSKYAWLFDNLEGCASYGCNIEDNNSYNLYNLSSTSTLSGYWTSSPVANITYYSWHVDKYGRLNFSTSHYDKSYGVRPVIEISKYNLLR